MTSKKMSFSLVIASLGVVFGDIGTSPIYAMHVTLEGLAVTPLDILGVLSLITWSLIIVISIKYLVFVFRADNEGEGGILALLALLQQKKTPHQSFLYIIAIFGTGLLLGDGMLTPAISVTSAVEGLKVLSPKFEGLAQVLSCFILFCIFALQSKGTGKIGATFGPIIFIWFITIAMLGLVHIIKNPMVLKAIHPYYAYEFFHNNGSRAFYLLSGVFLVVTGGEVLYADIGVFGKNPIRCSWFLIVFPSLVLSYFGQGANLLLHPSAVTAPFFMLAPTWFFIPLLVISTLATIIASQAIIAAVFSLTKQAILLGLYPKISIIQTSAQQRGQIYIPQMNILLLFGTLILIYSFGNSASLAHAYGFCVNIYMLLGTSMIVFAAMKVWKWSIRKTVTVFTLFFIVDLTFLGANAHKFLTGGWVPVIIALIIALIMYTWRLGLDYLTQNFYMKKEDISEIIEQLHYKLFNQLPGLTAIFITDAYDKSGGSFLHFLKLSLAVPENILILNYIVENKPRVSNKSRFELNRLDKKICQLTLHYGFMDTISIPEALRELNEKNLLPFEIKVENAAYLMEIPNIMASKKKQTLYFYWQEKLFAFLMRNSSANLNIEFYKIPYNRTIAIGTYCII